MKNKIVIIGIVIVLIIIILLIVSLFLLNGDNTEEKINEIAVEDNQYEENQTADEIIKQYYNDMKNNDFESAAELFDKDEFINYLDESDITENLEVFLEEAYKDSNEFYSYSIKSTRQIDDIEDFRDTTNIDITDEEYNEIFGNYLLYVGELNLDNTRAIDVYIFTNDYKMVCTIRLMNFYENTKIAHDILNDASENKDDTYKSLVKEELQMAISSLEPDYLIENNSSIDFIDYCNIENIQKNLHGATINYLEWSDGIGKGTITEFDTTYNFTLTQDGPTDISVSID